MMINFILFLSLFPLWTIELILSSTANLNTAIPSSETSLTLNFGYFMIFFFNFYSSKSITNIDYIISNVTKCENLTYLYIDLQ